MRYIVSMAALAAFVFSYIYMTSESETPSKAAAPAATASAAPAVAEAETAPPAADAVGVAAAPAADPNSAAIQEEIEKLAPRSTEFNELPDGDREWVVIETVRAYSVGQIQYGDLLDFIDQLSGVRHHKVIEREQPMFEPEEIEAPAHESEYN